MDDIVLKHLSAYFSLSSSEATNKEINILQYDVISLKDGKTLCYPKDLLIEITTIFSFSDAVAKNLIEKWANGIKPNVNLEVYWDLCDGLFPIIARVVARTVGLDLVNIQPMVAPNSSLFYMNYVSGTTSELPPRPVEIDTKKRKPTKPRPWCIPTIRKAVDDIIAGEWKR